jgi:alkylation response protein AidB-like acyl-CoA dehydrogenase
MSERQTPVSYTRHSPDAHVIRSDEEAIAIAHEIALLLQPGAAERDRSGTVAPEIIDTFSNSGLWGITVPRQWGGAEVSAATLAQVIAIISAADPSLGQIPQNHYCLLEDIRLQGSPEQQAFFWPGAAGASFRQRALRDRRQDGARYPHPAGKSR